MTCSDGVVLMNEEFKTSLGTKLRLDNRPCGTAGVELPLCSTFVAVPRLEIANRRLGLQLCACNGFKLPAWLDSGRLLERGAGELLCGLVAALISLRFPLNTPNGP